MKIIWKKVKHLAYATLESEQCYKEMQLRLSDKLPLIHKWQYKGWVKGIQKYSIIGPSVATFGMWEAYMGKDTPRFDTLKEAKKHCEETDF